MKVVLIIALLFPLTLTAQDQQAETPAPSAACATPEYRQFDFWIGEWNVSSGEQQAGTNSIHRVHNGCALQENWQGAGEGGISGSSFNIYDQATGRWHQTWIDANGTLLQLDGGRVDDAMVMSGTRPAPDGSGMVRHRISWIPNEDGSVRQLWEVSKDDGESWTILFDGLYTRASKDS